LSHNELNPKDADEIFTPRSAVVRVFQHLCAEQPKKECTPRSWKCVRSAWEKFV